MDLITRGCFMVGGRVKVTGSVRDTSSLSVPAGVTSITFTGQGGAGVYNAAANQMVYGGIPYTLGTELRYGVRMQVSTPPHGNIRVGGYGATFVNGILTLNSSGQLYAVASIYANCGGYNWIGPSAGTIVKTFTENETISTYTQIPISGYGWDTGQSQSVGSIPGAISVYQNLQWQKSSAYYSAGPSTTASSAQSTNGTKTWASHASAGSPAAYQQTMTLSGAAATISYSVASGTTLSYEYFL